MYFHGRVVRVSRARTARRAASVVLVASLSALPSVSPSPEVRSVSFSPVDPGMLGMHVAGAQEGD